MNVLQVHCWSVQSFVLAWATCKLCLRLNILAIERWSQSFRCSAHRAFFFCGSEHWTLRTVHCTGYTALLCTNPPTVELHSESDFALIHSLLALPSDCNIIPLYWVLTLCSTLCFGTFPYLLFSCSSKGSWREFAQVISQVLPRSVKLKPVLWCESFLNGIKPGLTSLIHLFESPKWAILLPFFGQSSVSLYLKLLLLPAVPSRGNNSNSVDDRPLSLVQLW